jgi:hypothetical protein
LDVDTPKTFDLERLRENRDRALYLELQKISAEIDQPDYKIGIECDITISDKPVYKTTKSIESILILKQLQYNLRKIYKVKQSNRFSIVNNVKIILSDGFPKIILKTDIKGFYENIPQKELLRKINNENLLTLSSRRIISQVLREYNDLTKNTTGVPRGIGISPYLVELYMRDIDSRIKNLAGVMYYARYVDDIIVIYTPSDSISPQAQKEKIKVILTEASLTMNEDADKTQLFDLRRPGNPSTHNFDYLGYKFSFGFDSTSKPMPLKVKMSTRKFARYKSRIDLASALYLKTASKNKKTARSLLRKRLRFLTSNFRLINNKKNILAGIYYSNSLINSQDDLYELDLHLKDSLSNSGLPQNVVEKILSSYSFVAGFSPHSVVKFKSSDYKDIKKGWI